MTPATVAQPSPAPSAGAEATPGVGEDSLPGVGFIGLGVMGRPMAGHLLAAGYPLVLHTRTRAAADELLSNGATWADSPADAAASADVVITMLPDSPEVTAVANGTSGIFAGAHAGLAWIDMSTIDPTASRALAAEAASRGVESLDAPVSGGERGAISASLSIMVGGPQSTFARWSPLLARLGTSVIRIGDAGAGQVAKACNQIVVGSTIALVAEALILARAAGVDPASVRDVLLGGLAQSRVLDIHGARMLDRAFEPGFRVRLHQKDFRIALDLARESAAPVPIAAIATQLFAAAAARGAADLDHSAAVMAYEQLVNRQLCTDTPDGTTP